MAPANQTAATRFERMKAMPMPATAEDLGHYLLDK
jgi:hypothetical protein